MALTDRHLTLVGLMKVEFPTRTIRICDGGRAIFAGEEYLSRDAVFGTIAAVEDIEDEIADMAPGGGFSLMPDPDAALTDIFYPGMQNSRVRYWEGEVDADMVNVSSAMLEADKIVDVPNWDPVAWRLDCDLIDRAEKFFLRNEGNVCSSAFHQIAYPGELGFENCTDTPGQVAWGVEAPPSSTIYSGTYGGSSGGGRSFTERRAVELR